VSGIPRPGYQTKATNLGSAREVFDAGADAARRCEGTHELNVRRWKSAIAFAIGPAHMPIFLGGCRRFKADWASRLAELGLAGLSPATASAKESHHPHGGVNRFFPQFLTSLGFFNLVLTYFVFLTANV